MIEETNTCRLSRVAATVLACAIFAVASGCGDAKMFGPQGSVSVEPSDDPSGCGAKVKECAGGDEAACEALNTLECCTPGCDGRECGVDDCGIACGFCVDAETCNDEGQCVGACTSNCTGLQCGDDGCGGSCGDCSADQSCNSAGQCVADCTQACSGKECGDDGCGGSCGDCSADQSCNSAGQCVADCTQACSGKECGDDGCGGSCGDCSAGHSCNSSGQCIADCTPNCTGLQCGDDGCGGSCGDCSAGDSCNSAGQCIADCTPACSGKECGDDGCGGSCGDCAAGRSCNGSGQCIADPRCGDGNLDPGEECDHGNPTATCSAECKIIPPRTDTVKVFLMAGQSNMEGNNASVDRLKKLLCHANAGMTYNGVTCGSTEITSDELHQTLRSSVQRDYTNAAAVDSTHPVVRELESFLSKINGLGASENCGSGVCDLTDRIFVTVSQYYCSTSNCGYGYDAFKHMTAAMGIADMVAEGKFTEQLLAQRADVTAMQYTYSLNSDTGQLNDPSPRYGNLDPNYGTRQGWYGPELIFGHDMGDAIADDVLLLKVVQGGTDLRVDWKTPCSVTEVPGNELTADELAQDSLYDELLRRAAEIQNNANLSELFPEYDGKPVKIAGFVWFQGWNDGVGAPLNTNNYEANLRCLIRQLREDLDLPQLPVVIGQSHVGSPTDPVQAAQATVASSTANTALAITDDLSNYYHFDNAAHLNIGRRMAAAMNEVYPAPDPDPCVPETCDSLGAACGTISDGCDGTLSCGGCADDEICTANQCELSVRCAIEGATCGAVRDGEGGATVDCGACSAGETCIANRCEASCSLATYGDGTFGGIHAYVPIQYTDSDVSQNSLLVTTTLLAHEDLGRAYVHVSRTELENKALALDLGEQPLALPYTLSFRLMPAAASQTEPVVEHDAFAIWQDGTGVTLRSADSSVSVAATGSTLHTRSCNQFAAVVSATGITTFMNGSVQSHSVNTAFLKDLAGVVNVGPYLGKVWDVRIYGRALTDSEMSTIGGDCDDGRTMQPLDPAYPNYMCTVYACIWWPDGVTDTTTESFQYQVNAHDMTWEHNVLSTGMYRHGQFCATMATGNGTRRDILLSDGYRRAWVNNYNYDRGWGNYVLHENFHAYQGHSGGGSKFLLESSANWGGYSQLPGTDDNVLLAYYTLQPHYALWADQSSPIADGIVDAFKGGHQYGAGIYWHYLTAFYMSEKLVGDIFNYSGHDARAAYELLSGAGYDMRDVFMEFAAKTITWDWPKYGPGYADVEVASYNRMVRANSGSDNPWPAEEIDNKVAELYDTNGTNGSWVAVPDRYKIGSWAYNVYQVDVTATAEYDVGVNTSVSNPVYAEFRARVVVHDEASGTRTYHPLAVGEPGVQSTIRVSVSAGDKLYLVVASTPSTVFHGWDAYTYTYLIAPR